VTDRQRHFPIHNVTLLLLLQRNILVLVAVARKLLIAVWHVLHDETDYVDFNPDCKAPANNR
jgi:hypothetical protein